MDEPEYLFKQAERCRAVAPSAINPDVRRTLLEMAKEYEERARAIMAKKK